MAIPTVYGRNPAPVENGGKHPIIHRVLTWFNHPRWCRISQPSTVWFLLGTVYSSRLQAGGPGSSRWRAGARMASAVCGRRTLVPSAHRENHRENHRKTIGKPWVCLKMLG